ncbi:MAG TPA: hypothetical protein VGH97_00235 [Thermoanaerobaculia bacterium]
MSRRVLLFVSVLALFGSASAQAAYSPATTNGWFITTGHVLGGGLFQTDIWLFNPDASADVTVTLVFHESVSSGGAAKPPVSSSPITLAPRETRFFADVTLATVPAGDGKVGALEWQSSAPIMGFGRIYTFTDTATFGFDLPAIPQSESMTAKTSADDSVNVLQMYGMNSGDTNFRTNLDITNTSGGTVPVEVRVIDPTTSEIYGGTQSYSVAPGSLLRLLGVLGMVGAPVKDGLRITVGVTEGTPIAAGGVLASAYTLDNRTQDAFAFVGQRQSATVVPQEILPFDVRP